MGNDIDADVVVGTCSSPEVDRKVNHIKGTLVARGATSAFSDMNGGVSGGVSDNIVVNDVDRVLMVIGATAMFNAAVIKKEMELGDSGTVPGMRSPRLEAYYENGASL